jgi:hypothetical protein
MGAAGADPSPRTLRLLRWAGWTLLGLTVVGLLAESPPGQLGSRIAGAALVATTGGAALVAARLARRQPWGRRLGLLAAGGMLFFGWAVTTRPASNLLTVLLGVALIVVGSVVG